MFNQKLSLLSGRKSDISGTLLLTTSLFFITLSLLVAFNVQKILYFWGESIQITTYFTNEASEEEKEVVIQFLKKQAEVDQVRLVSSEEALGSFKTQMASFAPDILSDSDLIQSIPESLVISLKPTMMASEQLNVIKDMETKLMTMAGVEQVSYGQEWVKNFSEVLTWFQKSGVFLLCVILLSSLYVSAFSVKSAIDEKRSEIEILEIIGATKYQIRTPFFIKGLVHFTIAQTSALVLSGVFYYFLKNKFMNELSFLKVSQYFDFLPVTWILMLFVSSIALGLISAWMSLQKMNTGWAAINQNE